MILAVAFTMGLAASTVSASTVDKKEKAKAKTETCAKAKECTAKDKKACCASMKAEEKPAAKTEKK